MTIKQLIKKLEEIENKELEVMKTDEYYWDYFSINFVEIKNDESGYPICLLSRE